MRISMILWPYGTLPRGFPNGPMGGAERALWEVSRRLAKRHRVRIFCKGYSDSKRVLENVLVTRVAAVPFKRVSDRNYLLKWISPDSYFLRALRGCDDDVVHSVTSLEPCMHHDRVLLHLENDIALHLPYPPAKKRVYAKKLGRIKAVVGVSRYVLARSLDALDLAEATGTVLHNGADTKFFRPRERDQEMLRRMYGIEANDVLVMYSGYIARKKGLHVLLEAVRAMKNVRLIVAGGTFYSKRKVEDETYLRRVQSHVRQMYNVVHVGPVGRNSLADLYACADILVVPSLWEDPCPLVVAEAMASGLPVVGTRSGGIPELVTNGKTGYIVPRSAERIRDAIMTLARDDTLRRRMSKNARRYAVRNLDWDVITAKIERVYRKIA